MRTEVIGVGVILARTDDHTTGAHGMGDDTDLNQIISAPGRVRFPDISPRAYEHPADRGVMATMRAVSGLSDILRALSGVFPERGERLMALGSCIRVGEKQYPKLHQMQVECAEILDLPRLPAMFVQRDPEVNALTIGIDEPFIILTTGLLDAMDDDSIRFSIGHEMGHVLSGHAVLRTLLVRLLSMQTTLSWIPAGALGIRAVVAALREWYRKAELTSDRAGLLCAQDPQAALRAHILLAGGVDPDEIDVPSFLQQAEEYLGVDDIRDSIHKLRAVEGMSHPLAVIRAQQLQKWAGSQEYRAILAGDYLRRSSDDPATLGSDLGGAAKSYKQAASESTDALVNALNNVGERVGKMGVRVGGWFNRPNDPSGPPRTDRSTDS